MKDLVLHFFTLRIDKRIRIILYFFQSIFSMVFASYLYKYFVGYFKLIEITDYHALIDFVITGRFLICLFFFATSWVLFYNIGYFIVLWLNKKLVAQIVNFIWKWFKKKVNEDDEDIDKKISGEFDKFLVKIGAIELTEDGKKNKGKKYNAYFRMSNHLKELSSDKRYLMPFLLLMMLLQFTLIYFSSFSNEISSMLLDVIIVIVFLVYLLSFFLTVFILELLVKLGNLVENRLQNI